MPFTSSSKRIRQRRLKSRGTLEVERSRARRLRSSGRSVDEFVWVVTPSDIFRLEWASKEFGRFPDFWLERFKHSWLSSIFPNDSDMPRPKGSNPLMVVVSFDHEVWLSRTNSMIAMAYVDLFGMICLLEGCNSLVVFSVIGRLEEAEPTLVVLNADSVVANPGKVFGDEAVFSSWSFGVASVNRPKCLTAAADVIGWTGGSCGDGRPHCSLKYQTCSMLKWFNVF